MVKTLCRPFELVCLLFIAGGNLFSPGCAKSEQTTGKTPLPALDQKRVLETATAVGPYDLSPPKHEEVRDAVLRVFHNAVTIETNRDPYFITGDFNGDRSHDLAVIVKPVPSKLTEINHELANWIIVDPVRLSIARRKTTPHPEMHDEILKRRRVRVDEGDVLLAVIHGFALKGWRDSLATQTYVLKGAAGEGIKTEARKKIVRADNKDKLPQITGDVIATTIGKVAGFLYYNG